MLPADRVILPPPDALSQAAYEQLSVGAYADGRGPAIIVLVAYGPVQTHSLQLHRPETCYPSSGFQILGQASDEIALGSHSVPVSWMEAKRGSRVDRLVYWTRIGNTFTSSLWDQRLAIAKQAFQGAPTDGVLVRISLEAQASDQTDVRLLKFVQAWLQALTQSDQDLLVGAWA
jgi:EpsI family protein